MIRLDNQTRNNWRNYESGDTIVEENLDRRDTSGVRTDIRPDAERIVLQKKTAFSFLRAFINTTRKEAVATAFVIG